MQAQRGSKDITPAHSQPSTRKGGGWLAPFSNYITLGKNLGPNV